MAATMIGGAVIGSGSTGVFAAEKYPSSATAKSAYSKVMSNTGTNYKNHMKITRRHMKIS